MRTMKLELRHALVVATIAEAGSISRAATQLGVPQPSLTAQLRRIERVVGGALFVRSSRGVSPTPFGERLIPMLVDILRRSEDVMSEARSAPAEILVLGSVESTVMGLPPFLDGVVSGAVRTVSLDVRRAREGLADGSLAATLVPAVEGAVDLVHLEGCPITPVGSEPVWLALASGHRALAGGAVDLRDLRSLAWVLRAEDHWFSSLERLLLGRLGVPRPEVVHRVASQAEALWWVATGEVGALVSPLAHLPGVEVVPLPPVVPALWIETSLVHRSSVLPDDLARRLAAGVRLHRDALAARAPRYRDWLRQQPAVGADRTWSGPQLERRDPLADAASARQAGLVGVAEVDAAVQP